MYSNFQSFYNNINNSEISDYFNCYSTFIMSKKDLKKDILNFRRDFIINYYLDETKNHNKILKKDLIHYYNNNIKDNYLVDKKEIERFPIISSSLIEEEKNEEKIILDYDLYLEKINNELIIKQEDELFIEEYNKFHNYYDYYDYTEEEYYNYSSYDIYYISDDDEDI